MDKKTMLVTGGSGNLGKAVVKRFLKEGWQVATFDRPGSGKKKAGVDTGTKSFELDLLDPPGVEKAVSDLYEHFGSFDFAVLTVGGFAMGSIEETGAEDLQKMFQLNFLTAYNVTRQLYILMKGGGGQIVLIGARPALHPAQAKGMLAYSLSKSLVFRLAEAINEENGNVRASVVIPSIIDTPQNRESMPDADFSKWVSPEEIAGNIFHLTTDAGQKLRESVIKVYGES